MAIPADFGYVELNGKDGSFSHEEELDLAEGKIRVTRVFRGPWSNRFDFIADCILRENISAGPGLSVFQVPDQIPGLNAFASRVRIKGMGNPSCDSTGYPKWENARISVTYEERNSGTSGGGSNSNRTLPDWLYIEEAYDTDAEILSLPGEDLRRVLPAGSIAETRLADKGPFNVIIVLTTMTLKAFDIVSPNWNIIQDMTGTVNSEIFISPSARLFPPGELRYDGVSGFTKTNLLTGEGENFFLPLWTMEHTFVYNKKGWNNKFVGGEWVEIETITGEPLYRKDDHNLLFRPGFTSEERELLAELRVLILVYNLALRLGTLDRDELTEAWTEIQDKMRELGFRV